MEAPGLRILLPVVLLASLGRTASREEESSREPRRTAAPEKPIAFERSGRLVCLPEEMQRLHGVTVAPVHDHVLGFRVDGELAAGEARYYTIIRTLSSKALYEDPRYAKRTLVLSGRRFPETALLEVTRFRWVRDGKLRELYYWCEVCSIRTFDPGDCACCQGPVEFRERAVGD